MARAARLKVFRLPIGFHDAYVAAPSQKAAAEAWGTDASVFARKDAELVTDPELTREPLAHPGEVVKRLRGTAAEQIAALGEEEPGTKSAPRRKPGPSSRAQSGPRLAPGSRKVVAKPKPPPKPKPRPSRAKLDEAEAAQAAAEGRSAAELKELREREAALARERRAIEAKQEKERARLDARREKAEAAYREAMARWRED
jgi:hypothetical protein